MKNKLPDAALFYAQKLHWAIFPLRTHDKKPATEHGFKDASRDLDTVRAWWQRTPSANVGLATGEAVVLDFDSYKPDFEGGALLDMLLEEYTTPTVDTPRGGVQLYFAQRPGLQLGNASGNLPKCVDVGGLGGYVALPPSIFTDNDPDSSFFGKTGTYTWRKGLEPWNAQLAPLPLFVVELILARGEPEKRPSGEAQDDVIAEFNRTHRIADMLTAHGYTVG